jgi:hypothetical protein
MLHIATYPHKKIQIYLFAIFITACAAERITPAIHNRNRAKMNASMNGFHKCCLRCYRQFKESFRAERELQ